MGWLIAAVAAMLIGISKTGVPGLGILAVVLFATVIPEGKSLGVVLPILMIADLFAVAYFRRRAHWPSLIRLVPATLIGILIGYMTLSLIPATYINRLIGVMVLGLLVMQVLRETGRLGGEHLPNRWWFPAAMGLLAGFATMVANAAGPITILYLVAMRLDKMRFMGTAAWFYLIFNWVKFPFLAGWIRLPFFEPRAFITAESLLFDAKLIPAIVVGVALGIFALKRIPQKTFQRIVLALAALQLAILGGSRPPAKSPETAPTHQEQADPSPSSPDHTVHKE